MKLHLNVHPCSVALVCCWSPPLPTGRRRPAACWSASVPSHGTDGRAVARREKLASESEGQSAASWVKMKVTTLTTRSCTGRRQVTPTRRSTRSPLLRATVGPLRDDDRRRVQPPGSDDWTAPPEEENHVVAQSTQTPMQGLRRAAAVAAPSPAVRVATLP